MRLKLVNPKPSTEPKGEIEITVHQDGNGIGITTKGSGDERFWLLRLSSTGIDLHCHIPDTLGFELDDAGRLKVC